jgi:hypothetical protein
MKKKKCLILLPTRFNDGKDVPPSVFSRVLRSIDETLDYYSVGGLCDGVYKMDDGSKAHDRSVMVWAVVAPEKVDELRALAARIAGMLQQESLYFEVTEVDFGLVRPSDENGDSDE